MLAGLGAYWLLFDLLGAIAAGILGTLLMFAAHPVRKPWLYLLNVIFWTLCPRPTPNGPPEPIARMPSSSSIRAGTSK